MAVKSKEFNDKGVGEEIEIDPHRLDEEWLTQAPLYWKYARLLADERKLQDQAKRKLAVIMARVEMAIRKDPEKFDLPKVTESAIKSSLTLDDDVQEAEALIIKTTHQVNVLGAVVGALDHRKRALSDLVQLHQSQYFAEPKAQDPQTRQEVDESKRKQTRERHLKRVRERDKK